LTALFIVNTAIPVNITYDPNKDAANLAKHGVSLFHAAEFEWVKSMGSDSID
jgi:uncharacterized DUF497 family protein